MAGSAVTVTPEFSTAPEGVVERLRASHNTLIDDVELLRAAIVAIATKLDADAGVTDTNYAAQATVAAINPATDLTAFKVNLRS